MEQLQAGRLSVCGDALFILLAPFIQNLNELQAVWLRSRCGDLTSRSENLNRAPASSIVVEKAVNNDTCWYL